METETPTPIMEETDIAFQPFAMYREEDVTGVSGTGVVAVGMVLPSGRVVLEWIVNVASIGLYGSLQEVEQVHGHDGKTLCQLGPKAVLTVSRPSPGLVFEKDALILVDPAPEDVDLGPHIATVDGVAAWKCLGCGRGPDGFMCPKRDVNKAQPHLTKGRHPTAVEFAATVESGAQHPPCPKCGLYGEHRGPDGHVYKLNLPDADVEGQPWQCDGCGTYEKDGRACPRSAAGLAHPK